MPYPTPRVFIIRHGETEWSLDGRHTGTTDIPLTAAGEARVTATGKALVGDDRLITRRNIAVVLVSPRKRARRTLELLMGEEGRELKIVEPSEEMPTRGAPGGGRVLAKVTDDVREWDYGEYEGRTSDDIAQERKQKGLGEWEIWRDGCPGGESPEQITTRLDRVISHIRKEYHEPALQHAAQKKAGRCPPCDVLVVAHGHILRAFAARWVGRNVSDNPSLILEAGGVGSLSYEHHNIDEPAILLGGSFVVDVAEAAEQQGKEKEAAAR